MTAPWRLVLGPGTALDPDDLGLDGAGNMAVDHVLFDTARTNGSAAVRFYRWTPACLSLGRNQPARGRYRGTPGRDVVRRPTGGLAVFHDQELTYSVTCPVGAIGSPRETYRAVHRALAHGLATLGARTFVSDAERARSLPPHDPAGVCFHAPAEGEVLADAGKLVGSAQRCEDRTLLQHGSILIDGSQDRAAALDRITEGAALGPRTASGTAVAASAETTLAALLGRTPPAAELIGALTAAIEERLGIRLAPGSLSADERAAVREAETRYRSDDWTWRS